jgi:hypothetical protein
VDSIGVNSIDQSLFANTDSTPIALTVTGSAIPAGSHIQFTHSPQLFDQAALSPVACPQGDTHCGVVENSGTTLKEYFVFSGVAPGAYDVRIIGPGANPAIGRCDCQINVVSNTPAITKVEPNQFVQGTTAKTVTITGTNLYPGDRVVVNGGDGKVTIVADSEQVAADHLSMTFKISVAQDADTAASRTVQVKDSSSPAAKTSGTLPITLTKAPTVSSVTPAQVGQGGVTPKDSNGKSTFTIKGLNWVVGADPASSTTFGFCAGVTASDLTITKGTSGADDTATMTIAVAPDAAVGKCAITLTNPDGGTFVSDKFEIGPAPVIDNVTPAATGKGKTLDVTLNGNFFFDTASVHPTVAFLIGNTVDPKITVNTITVQSATKLVANITTAADAAQGQRSVRVTNPDYGVKTCTNCFAIATVPGAPTNVRGRAGDGRVQVSWTKPASDGGSPISSYVVTATPGGSKVVVASGNATSATLKGLANGTAYTFAVEAANAIGQGPAASSAAVRPAPISRLVAVKPIQRVSSITGRGIPGGTKARLQNQQFDVPLPDAPAEAVGAVINIWIAPSATTYLKVYGTGTPAPGAVTAYGLPGIAKSGTAYVNFGATKSIHVAVYGGPASVQLNQVAWLERLDQEGSSSQLGGVLVPTDRTLINYRTSTTGPVPGANLTHFFDFNSSLPDVEAISLQVSTSNSRTSGTISAYAPADGPIATSHTFTAGRLQTTNVITRVSKVPTADPNDSPSAMTYRVYFKVNGQTGLLVQMVGYWSSNVSAFAGHHVALSPTRILSATTPRTGEIRIKVPDTVPGSTTGVLVAITAWDTTGSTTLRVYPDRGTPPASNSVSYVRGDKATNLAITGVGDNRYIIVKVYGPSTKLYVDLLGYIN